MQKIQNSIETN